MFQISSGLTERRRLGPASPLLAKALRLGSGSHKPFALAAAVSGKSGIALARGNVLSIRARVQSGQADLAPRHRRESQQSQPLRG